MSFFFQAEEGIRAYKVTGVQTCALPISRGERARRAIGMIATVPDLPIVQPGGEPRERADAARNRQRILAAAAEIGRASCRERGESMGVGAACKTRTKDASGDKRNQDERR